MRTELRGLMAAAVGATSLAGGATAAPARNEVVVVPVLASGTPSRVVNLDRMGTRLVPGQTVGWVKPVLAFCMGPNQPVPYDAEAFERMKQRLSKIFDAEVTAAGFTPAADSSGLFAEEGRPETELLVAASLDAEHVETCQIIDSGSAKGTASAEFTWQIYSTIEKKIVASYRTTGTFTIDKFTSDPSVILDGVVQINVRKFLASQQFRTAFTGAERKPDQIVTAEGVKPGSPPPLTYANVNKGPSTVSDAVGGVVAIFQSNSMGSGFLIGSEGLVLTNQHVVGSAKYLKIRWPDGIETLGEVVRADKNRDVALVKTDPRGRTPLKLSMTSPLPGEDVYAIGSPLDEKYQNSVSKGVVSANRVFDGLRYIQSDVLVNHGNSGGPLLDKNANVVGLTQSGEELGGGVPAGLNLFIPLRDAMEFLALKPTSTAAAAPPPKG